MNDKMYFVNELINAGKLTDARTVLNQYAGNLQANIKDFICNSITENVTVYPAYRHIESLNDDLPSRYRISDWHGQFRITVRVNTYDRHPNLETEKRLYVQDDLEKIRRLFNNFRPWIYHVNQYCKIIWMYRASGLIPQHIAEEHAIALKSVHGNGWYKDLEAVKSAWFMMYDYISTEAICPKCKEKFNPSEEIWGWRCTNCNRSLNDTGKKIYWDD